MVHNLRKQFDRQELTVANDTDFPAWTGLESNSKFLSAF